ncbi:unnamed protein product [Rodentolepis nana]|uniref:SH3 domain-containing protein n=1 Tax=Rodentolepis nana TaxID=102285 RepID=A0A0R3T9D9_RODNA|nr:unnamed protein product [Rodentolepis nana]
MPCFFFCYVPFLTESSHRLHFPAPRSHSPSLQIVLNCLLFRRRLVLQICRRTELLVHHRCERHMPRHTRLLVAVETEALGQELLLADIIAVRLLLLLYFPRRLFHQSLAESSVLFYARAQYDFEGDSNPLMLPLSCGDIVHVISTRAKEQGWWKGWLNGRIGFFPLTFVTRLS